jgi:hypothetical protein
LREERKGEFLPNLITLSKKFSEQNSFGFANLKKEKKSVKILFLESSTKCNRQRSIPYKLNSTFYLNLKKKLQSKESFLNDVTHIGDEHNTWLS